MARERLINRRQQGDLGEFSAMEWLASVGAVWIPLGHSPDVDLLAEVDGRLLRVQVKTSTRRKNTPSGHLRWSVHIATNGGNQSWNGVSKRFDPTRADCLFALVGDGRRWLIPATAIEEQTGITLGGSKYSEFEIEPGRPIQEIVYGADDQPLKSETARGSVGVRRAERVCKIRALVLSEFESHLPHQHQKGSPPIRTAQTRVSANHQVTVPRGPFEAAALRVGDRMRVSADGDGRVILERIHEPSQERLALEPSHTPYAREG